MTNVCNATLGCLDRTTNGVLGIESEHVQFYLGNVYDFHFYNPTLASGANQDILVAIPNTIAFFHMFEADAKITGAPARVFLYEAPTVSANGSLVTINQLNRLSSNVAATVVYSGPTMTVVGTQIHFDLITGSTQAGGATSGFTYPDHMVLKPNTNYLFRLTNDAPSTQAAAMHMAWFESATGIL